MKLQTIQNTVWRRERPAIRAEAILVVVAGMITMGIGGYLWWGQFLFAIKTIQQKYGVYSWFSDHCAVAVLESSDFPNDVSIFSKEIQFTPARVPMRLEGAQVFRAKHDQFIAVRCYVDLSGLRHQAEPWVAFGTVSGHSTIFINRVAAYFGRHSENIAFYLRASDLISHAEITIVSRRDENQNAVGLTGTIPLMYGNGGESLKRITNYWKAYFEENALVRLGVTTGFALMFCVLWLRGIRYPDVEWMIVALFALCLFPLSQRLYAEGISVPFSFEFTFIYFVEAAAIGGFVIAFTRSQLALKWYRVLAGIFVFGGIPLYSYLYANFHFNPLTNFIVSVVWLMAVLMIAAWINLQNAQRLNRLRKQRSYLISAFCAVGAIGYGFQASVMFSKVVILAPFINYGLMAIFGVFVMTDLVINQDQLRRAKMSEELKERELGDLKHQLVIARSIQQALLPSTVSGKSKELAWKILYEPFDTVAGDWIVIEAFQGGEIFLTGDIIGKGPPAALAMAAIVGIVRSAVRATHSLDELVKSISTSVVKLFSGTMTTTLSVVFVSGDSDVKICCFGTPPIMLVKCGGVEVVNSSGGFVGMSVIEAGQWTNVQRNEVDALICLSDGFIAGARDMLALSKLLEAIEVELTTGEIAACIETYLQRRPGRINDDRSGLILTTRQLAA